MNLISKTARKSAYALLIGSLALTAITAQAMDLNRGTTPSLTELIDQHQENFMRNNGMVTRGINTDASIAPTKISTFSKLYYMSLGSLGTLLTPKIYSYLPESVQNDIALNAHYARNTAQTLATHVANCAQRIADKANDAHVSIAKMVTPIQQTITTAAKRMGTSIAAKATELGGQFDELMNYLESSQIRPVTAPSLAESERAAYFSAALQEKLLQELTAAQEKLRQEVVNLTALENTQGVTSTAITRASASLTAAKNAVQNAKDALDAATTQYLAATAELSPQCPMRPFRDTIKQSLYQAGTAIKNKALIISPNHPHAVIAAGAIAGIAGIYGTYKLYKYIRSGKTPNARTA